LTSDQEAELECLNLGAIDFIPKPYPRWEIVRARVNKCIELSEDRNIIRETERDSLTSLFNIDYFLRYVKMYDQNYWDMPMDAVVVDINQFRQINERCGRQFGDKLLQRIGERVRKLARKLGGVGSRQGADNFQIYCPHQENYPEILDQLSASLTEDEDSSCKVQLRMGVYADVDKNLDIKQRFDNAKSAKDSVNVKAGKTVGFYDANGKC
jgi:diguanylate cyclase (GGDEF)-like protein